MSKKREQDIKFGCRTDVGLVRQQNEDSLLAMSPLFAVADGMGGHAAGEVASEIAIQTLKENAPQEADAQALANAVSLANKEIIKAAEEGKGKQGMGTTMTAAYIEGNKMVLAQVGDSRAYLLHNGSLQQITRDHSLMADLIEQGQITPAEARVHPNRSLITRALGNDPDMHADQYEMDIYEGDRLLICSDGLSSVLTDDIISGFLNETKDPQECADKLIEQANAHGGPDNITVIIVDINGFVDKKKKSARKFKWTIFFVIFLLLAIIAGAFGLGYYITQNSAYISEENGYVCVYKGIPGSFMGINFSSKEYTTDILVSNLRESTRQHFKDGVIKVQGLEEAENIVNNYREEANSINENKEKEAQYKKDLEEQNKKEKNNSWNYYENNTNSHDYNNYNNYNNNNYNNNNLNTR